MRRIVYLLLTGSGSRLLALGSGKIFEYEVEGFA
jgi:hypothetical protein